jgi:hypothetical protein
VPSHAWNMPQIALFQILPCHPVTSARTPALTGKFLFARTTCRSDVFLLQFSGRTCDLVVNHLGVYVDLQRLIMQPT